MKTICERFRGHWDILIRHTSFAIISANREQDSFTLSTTVNNFFLSEQRLVAARSGKNYDDPWVSWPKTALIIAAVVAGAVVGLRGLSFVRRHVSKAGLARGLLQNPATSMSVTSQLKDAFTSLTSGVYKEATTLTNMFSTFSSFLKQGYDKHSPTMPIRHSKNSWGDVS